MGFAALYRARATQVNQDPKPDGSAGTIVAFIPTVFGEQPVQITESIGSMPTSPEMGWVFFQAGNPEFPVWVGKLASAGGGSSAPAPDEVWIGPDDPRPFNPAIEMWYDTDAVPPTGVTGLPAGGTVAGQVLTKQSATDYDAVWSEPEIRRFTTLANRNTQWPVPAKGSIAIITDESAPYNNVNTMLTMWDGATWQWVRSWGVPWGIVKKVEPGNNPNVQVAVSGTTYLHTPLVYTFLAGRQYKLCWNIRAAARTDNNGAFVSVNMGLFDGTTATGWIDQWNMYGSQWSNFVGQIPFTDSSARSLRLGFTGTPSALTLYLTAVWIEDMGPVAP